MNMKAIGSTIGFLKDLEIFKDSGRKKINFFEDLDLRFTNTL